MAPGAYDCLTAKLIETAGFPAVYMTGAGTSVARLGYPDLALATMTEMLDNAAQIASIVDIPVIADADTGYGGILNVRRTVRQYERSGVAALHLEDQEFPKRCGHLDDKRVIATADMVQKIHAAVDARTDDDFTIIVRTDAIAVTGWDDAMRRCEEYVQAGADVLFVEAPSYPGADRAGGPGTQRSPAVQLRRDRKVAAAFGLRAGEDGLQDRDLSCQRAPVGNARRAGNPSYTEGAGNHLTPAGKHGQSSGLLRGGGPDGDARRGCPFCHDQGVLDPPGYLNEPRPASLYQGSPLNEAMSAKLFAKFCSRPAGRKVKSGTAWPVLPLWTSPLPCPDRLSTFMRVRRSSTSSPSSRCTSLPISFGLLVFGLIDYAFPDALDYREGFPSGEAATAIASVIVAFPLYLFLARWLGRQAAEDPERRQSLVRRWLTYITLVVAAGFILGDLIALLANVLGGDPTLRFALKAVAILAITGCIFGYYLWDMRQTESSVASSAGAKSLRILAAAVVIVVAGCIAYALFLMGSPGQQRDIRLDRDRVSHLSNITDNIDVYWKLNGELPTELTEMSGPRYALNRIHDPERGGRYEYRVLENANYELCAVFSTDSAEQEQERRFSERAWYHGKGRTCFPLEAQAE